MSRPYRIQDGEAWLKKAAPLKQPLAATVTHKGKRVARLYGEHRSILEQRVNRFVEMVGYRSAEVSIA